MFLYFFVKGLLPPSVWLLSILTKKLFYKSIAVPPVTPVILILINFQLSLFFFCLLFVAEQIKKKQKPLDDQRLILVI